MSQDISSASQDISREVDEPDNPLKTNGSGQASLKDTSSLLRVDKSRVDKDDAHASYKNVDRLQINEEFDFVFWPLAKNQIDKRGARKAYHEARDRTDKDTIVNGLIDYQNNKPADQKWLNPTTFLNEDRWADKPASVSKGSGRIAEAFQNVERKLGITDK